METKKKSNHNQPFNCSSQSTQRINLHMPGELQVASAPQLMEQRLPRGGPPVLGQRRHAWPGKRSVEQNMKIQSPRVPAIFVKHFLWNTSMWSKRLSSSGLGSWLSRFLKCAFRLRLDDLWQGNRIALREKHLLLLHQTYWHMFFSFHGIALDYQKTIVVQTLQRITTLPIPRKLFGYKTSLRIASIRFRVTLGGNSSNSPFSWTGAECSAGKWKSSNLNLLLQTVVKTLPGYNDIAPRNYFF